MKSLLLDIKNNFELILQNTKNCHLCCRRNIEICCFSKADAKTWKGTTIKFNQSV